LDSIPDIASDYQEELPYQKNFTYYLSMMTVSNDSEVVPPVAAIPPANGQPKSVWHSTIKSNNQ